ncbi:hypothetical protein AV926_08215 [Myroides marinus]|uniref:Fructan beta-fructosidase n=2 Tax=Myroides marinus TaxID=703342 RepID=A0A163Z8L3_9FLAO|nr:hypothetical protein AS361_09200 [Myroides marinus]KZE81263.1 hypothetical protein AV926_08215 [Myroides marinus]
MLKRTTIKVLILKMKNMKHTHRFQVSVTDKYLLFPYHDKSDESQISILDNKGNVIRQFHTRITDKPPLYYIKFDSAELLHTTVVLSIVTDLPLNSVTDIIKQSSDPDPTTLDDFRPVYHFTAPTGWLSSPNGLFYKKGNYHLYYQHNAYGNKYENIISTHAVSDNMIDWHTKNTPTYIGNINETHNKSIVIDKENIAGFGKNAILAFYTSCMSPYSIHLAYSSNKGKTFTSYTNNPILAYNTDQEINDPKVFWHDASKSWIMVISTSPTISIYNSSNLKDWNKLSDFGVGISSNKGTWHSPDLFELPYGKTTKWVLLLNTKTGAPNGGSGTQYFIGEFDGKTFTADNISTALWLDYGKDHTSSMIWHNTPKDKVTYIAWMSNWEYTKNLPSKAFKNAMTIPRNLELGTNGEQIVLKSYPVKELKKIREEVSEFQTQLLDKSLNIQYFLDDNQGAYEIILEFDIVDTKTQRVKFSLLNTEGERLQYTLDLTKGLLLVDRSESGDCSFSKRFSKKLITAPLQVEKKYKFKLYVDKCSAELFLNKGKTVMTNLIFPSEPYNSLQLSVEEGRIDITKFRVHSLHNS